MSRPDRADGRRVLAVALAVACALAGAVVLSALLSERTGMLRRGAVRAAPPAPSGLRAAP